MSALFSPTAEWRAEGVVNSEFPDQEGTNHNLPRTSLSFYLKKPEFQDNVVTIHQASGQEDRSPIPSALETHDYLPGFVLQM